MPVKIRLQRKGRKKRPYYHIVIADVRAPRDGKYIERIGMYNPMTKPATIDIDRDKAYDWLMKGAQPTDTARAILKFKGIYYKKHLMRGVKKGALTQEEAEKMYQEWIDQKESRIAARFEQSAQEKAAYHSAVSGTAPVVETPVVEEEAAEEETAEEAAEEAVATAEATEETQAAEEETADAAEEATEEAPAEEEAAKEEATEEEAASEEGGEEEEK